MSTLRAEITAYLRAGRLKFTESGTRALKRLGRGHAHRPAQTAFDPESLFGSRGLEALFESGALQLDKQWATRVARFDDLQRQSDARTVAVFVAPLNPPRV